MAAPSTSDRAPDQSANAMIERAYELARSGRFRGLDAIKAQLKLDGYSHTSIREVFFGFGFRKALRELCRAARTIS